MLIEEFLDGQEISLFFLTDGHDVVPLSPAQDYKRVGDGDAGPNTGGMGAYSPLPWLADDGSERRSSTRCSTPIALPDRPRARGRGHPVHRPALLRAHRHRRRHPGHRVQRALRRPRDPGRAAAARDAALGAAARRGDRRARQAAVPEVLATTPPSSWCSPARATPTSRSPAARSSGLDAAAEVAGVTIAHAATAARRRRVSSPPAAACSASSPAAPTSPPRAPPRTRPSAASTSRAASTATTSPRGSPHDRDRVQPSDRRRPAHGGAALDARLLGQGARPLHLRRARRAGCSWSRATG